MRKCQAPNGKYMYMFVLGGKEKPVLRDVCTTQKSRGLQHSTDNAEPLACEGCHLVTYEDDMMMMMVMMMMLMMMLMFTTSCSATARRRIGSSQLADPDGSAAVWWQYHFGFLSLLVSFQCVVDLAI